MSMSQSQEPVLIRPRRSLGELFPDVVVEESHEDSLQITEHPVEQGASINDHAFRMAEKVTIRGGVSDARESDSGGRPSVEFYEQLLELQRSREPLDIITGKRAYKNMLLERLSVITDPDSEAVLAFVAECREVIIVKTRVATVPRSRQRSASKTGGTEDKGQKQPQKRQSMLKGGLG